MLQLNEIDERDQQVIVATLLRRINKRGWIPSAARYQPDDETYLPYPVFLLLEEAHHFAPHGGDAITTGILKQVLAEGRKFGIGVGLISQRPGKLDADVLSQCLTQCIMRIVNEVDQKSVATRRRGRGPRSAWQPARALQGAGDHRGRRDQYAGDLSRARRASRRMVARAKTPRQSGRRISASMRWRGAPVMRRFPAATTAHSTS